jgi:hypothetical protein
MNLARLKTNPEGFMTKQNLKNLSLSLCLLATALISSTSPAQGVGPAAKLRRAPVMPSTAQAAARQADTSNAPSYTYTLIAYPGTLNTQGVGINPGAFSQDSDDHGGARSKIDIVGAWFFPDGTSQTGFRASVSGTKAVTTETYELLNDPSAPTPQQAYSINDFGQIVGDYIDSSNVFHAYEVDHGKFKPLEVPFAGATGTYSPAINNSGEIVGLWNDSAQNTHGFTLIEGTYTSFDYPGGTGFDLYLAVNSEGNIVGTYIDASGNYHGFLRKGKTYTSIDFPGAIATLASGINDSDEIVGTYCTINQCLYTGEGEQGFVLKNGVYTSFAIPGEFATDLAVINNKGVIMGNYTDAAMLNYTFLATP